MASIRLFVFLVLVVTVIQLKLVWAQSPCRPDWRGDGFCDSGCNTKQYGFDDGDCCEETCKSKHRQYQCGLFGYECSVANPASTELPTSPSTQLPTQPPTPSVPLWFVTQTEICYNSRSPAAPDWFRDSVRICYQWFADGDGGQCGGGADHILCAGVGNFTAEYRDNTDNRAGGCKMSWMLSVPASCALVLTVGPSFTEMILITEVEAAEWPGKSDYRTYYNAKTENWLHACFFAIINSSEWKVIVIVK